MNTSMVLKVDRKGKRVGSALAMQRRRLSQHNSSTARIHEYFEGVEGGPNRQTNGFSTCNPEKTVESAKVIVQA